MKVGEREEERKGDRVMSWEGDEKKGSDDGDDDMEWN